MSRGSMSERQRVVLALRGQRFPREGQRGLCVIRVQRRSQIARVRADVDGVRQHSEIVRVRAEVEVVRVSPSGSTIWTRFVSRVMQYEYRQYGDEHRWWRVPDDDIGRVSVDELLYRAGSDSTRAPTGEVSFPDVMPEDAL